MLVSFAAHYCGAQSPAVDSHQYLVLAAITARQECQAQVDSARVRQPFLPRQRGTPMGPSSVVRCLAQGVLSCHQLDLSQWVRQIG